LALPVLLLYFLFRDLRTRGYWRSLPQRFGFLPRSFTQTGPGAIWLHAVSVGEVLSCLEFLRQIRARFPHSALFVSTSTLTGKAMADEKLRGLADGVFFAPVDYVFAVRRVLRTLRPSVVVVAETELWPNLFREVKRTGAALTIVNGRISDNAYQRYAGMRLFFRSVLPALDSTLAQTPAIRDRFLALGAPDGRVRVNGNFKYDFEARAVDTASPVVSLVARMQPSAIWVAASTSAPMDTGDVDEDDVVIDVYRQLSALRPELLLILAPRKPERFDVVAGKLSAAGIPYVRRQSLGSGDAARVLLLDTIGELSSLFSLADVVFMGGTLAQRGGHNILEPALFGKPVIIGPHMENFQAIGEEFRAADACIEIARPQELAGAVEKLLADAPAAREIGRRAQAHAEARRGATARAVEEVARLHHACIPRSRAPLPKLWLAWPLARIWEWGAKRRQRRDGERRRRLDVPVISVGNLTMGGTGKTPCVLRLAELLNQRGQRPGILTRGYGRNSPHEYVTVAPGGTVPVQLSGDEPQIFIRSGEAAVGIGADRFEAGTRLLREIGAGVLLLDDGFQHWKLARDLEIVLIDGINPFGGGDVFPLGRLREPVAGLSRADVVIITRAAQTDLADAIEQEVRRWNPHAPVLRGTVQPHAWVEHATGRCLPASPNPFGSAGVFCGLGNPESFRRTLQAMGVEIASWIDFDDHHRYRPRELTHIVHHMTACGATALITTEKDSVNLSQDCDQLLAPLPLYWLQVKMRIEGEDRLVEEVERRIESRARSVN
jgi:3-deoxy-D-manno-octulosonic-acid transferase